MFGNSYNCNPAFTEGVYHRLLIQVYPNYNFGTVLVNIIVDGNTVTSPLSIPIPNYPNPEAWYASSATRFYIGDCYSQ